MSRSRQILAAIGVLIVAGTMFISAPAQAKPVPETLPGQKVAQAALAGTYVVRQGDTLSELAATWCGSQGQWPAVHGANPQVRNPHLIYVGQVLNRSCAGPVTRPAQQTVSRSTRSSGWSHPLGNSVRARDWMACPGAPRDGHIHQGVDLSGDYGDRVLSVTAGEVIYSGSSGTAGLYLKVDHGRYVSTYMHLNKKLVGVGATVSSGQQIGTVGATGNAKGPHLHFEIVDTWDYRNGEGVIMRAYGVSVGC